MRNRTKHLRVDINAVPSVGVRDNGGNGVETADHLSGLDKVIEGGNSEVGHSKTRSGGCCARLVQAVEASF